MPELQQIKKQIAALDPVEREQFFFEMAEDLLVSDRYMLRPLPGTAPDEFPLIVTTPGVCGGSARVIRTRIPVWVVERMRQLGMSDMDILRSYPTLRAVDLVQACSYAARYRTEIEQEIRENEEE